MRPTVVALAVLLVALALAVPTVATDGGSDEVAERIELSPHDGPNGEYASVEDGELRVDLEGLNDEATTTAHEVVDVTSNADEPLEVWVETDEPAITAYEGDDPGARLSRDAPRTLEPGETLSVGFDVDTHGETAEEGTVTIGVREPASDADPDTGGSAGETGGPTGSGASGPTGGTGGRTVEGPTGDVEVVFDGGGADAVAIEHLEELPPDGEPSAPRVAVHRGGILSGQDDDGVSVHGDRLVTTPGEPVLLTGSQSTVYGASAIAPGARPPAIVRITPPAAHRDRPATVRLRVDRDDVAGDDPTTARVARHTDAGWQVLPTRVTSATAGSVTFETRTAGLGVFAVFPEAGVDYRWTLPDGETVRDSELRTTFVDPGVHDATLRVSDATGRSASAERRVVVNDEPTVTIDGASAAAGEPATLRANVTDEVGDVTITWTLPDGSTATGETVTGEFAPGDRVSVRVEDEYGPAATAETTLGSGPLFGGWTVPGIQTLPPGVPPWTPLAVATGAVGLAAGAVRSSRVHRWISVLLGLGRQVVGRLGDDAPRITAFEDARWYPERGCVEIETLEIVAPSGLLRSVDFEVTDGDGERIVRKSVEVGARSSYSASPERIPVHDRIDLSESDGYDVTVRAVDEDHHVDLLEASWNHLVEPAPDSS